MISIFKLRLKSRFLCLLSVLFLSACAMDDLSRYQQTKPALDLEKFFVGTVDASGMFQKYNGEVVRRMQVVITGKMEDGKLVLDEQFRYDDGKTEQRIWRLQKQADGSWRGQAADVKGEAFGQISGNTLNWRYTLLLPVDGKVYEMALDDWMYLLDENTMMNRASMRKFGLEVGQVTLFFKRRVPPAKS